MDNKKLENILTLLFLFIFIIILIGLWILFITGVVAVIKGNFLMGLGMMTLSMLFISITGEYL